MRGQGKIKRATISDPRAPKPLDLVDRNSSPPDTPGRFTVHTTAQFFCSTWAPSLELPGRDRVKLTWRCSHKCSRW